MKLKSTLKKLSWKFCMAVFFSLLSSFSYAGKTVLICAATTPSWSAEVQSKLQATGQFTTVDVFDISSATPTLAQLQAYTSVLLFTDGNPSDPAMLGDNLAAFIDGGGGVVSAVFATASVPIGGNFNTAAYRVIIPANQTQGSTQTLGTVHIPSHYLMTGVTNFDGGTSSYRTTSTTLETGGFRVADWSDGNFLITARENVGPLNVNRVDLGFFPPSSDARSDFWVTSSDGIKIMVNALTWVSGISIGFTIHNVSCTGGSDGSVSSTVSGGSAPYTYIWSTGATTPAISNLSAANYTLTVTDAQGSSFSHVASVTQPAILTTSISATHLSCHGGATGMVKKELTSLDYSWLATSCSGPQNLSFSINGTETYAGLADPGTCGCTPGIKTTTVTTAAALAAIVDGNNTFESNFSGVEYQSWAFVKLNFSDGSSQLVKLFENYNSNNGQDDNLCNGYMNYQTYTANENVSLLMSGAGGEINLTVMNGVPPFTYLWSNGATTQDIAVTSGGTYSVTAMDSCGFTSTSAVTINEPSAINATTVVTNTSGTAATDGAIDLTVTGGTSPYVYLWSNGATTQDITNLSAGAYTAGITDANGCSAVATATVVDGGGDTTPPTAICKDTTVYLDANGNASITPGHVNNGSYDASGIESMTVSPNNFICSNAGANTVTLTVMDTHGNISTCTATVTVKDTVAPTAVCQNITLQLDANGQVSLAGTPVTFYDYSCDLPTQTFSDVSQSFIAPYSGFITQVGAGIGLWGTSVAYGTIISSSSNTVDYGTLNYSGRCCYSSCTPGNNMAFVTLPNSFYVSAGEIVTVSFTGSAGELHTDGNQIRMYVTGLVGTAASLDGGSTDACGIASFAVDSSNFTCADLGENTVTLIVTDVNGNSSTCTAIVTIEDTIAPAAVCKNITVQLDANGQTTITAADVDGGSTDACGIATLAINNSNFTCANVGTNNVILTVTDVNGNVSTCTAIVTVEDHIAPVAICKNITIQLNASGAASIVANDVYAGATDACGTASIAIDSSNFTCANIGTNNVTLTVTDVNGNSSTCIAVVTVEDTIAPVITCPSNIVVNNVSGQCDADVNYTIPVGSDNCSVNVASKSFSFTGSVQDWSVPEGVTLITIKAAGARGGSNNGAYGGGGSGGLGASVQGEFNVIPGQTLHVLAGSHGGDAFDDSFSLNTGGGGGSFVWKNDNTLLIAAGGGSGFGTCTSQPSAPGLATLGGSGNGGLGGSISCGQGQGGGGGAGWLSNGNSTESYSNIGGQAPLNGGAGGPSGAPESGYTSTAGGFGGGGGGAGNCGGPGGGGGYTGGNGGDNIICSGGQYVSGGTSYNIGANQWGASGVNNDNGFVTISWNVGGGPELIASQIEGLPPGSFFPVGTTTVTYTATDPSGNADTCSFTITVIDNEAPISLCKNIIVQLDTTGHASITAADVDGGSTDNCGIASISIDNSNFTCANVGTNNVTLSVTDVNGNVSTCVAIVTVEDSTAPVALCKNITIQLNANGQASIIAADVDGGSSDNCGIASITIDKSSFTCANVGANSVTLTVTDVNGNVSTCVAIVTVEDNITPTAVCKNITVQLDANGQVTIVAADIDDGSMDNCGIASISINNSNFTCSNVGANNVILTVTDVNGNVSTCTAIVTVEDNIAPAAVCKNITVQLDASGNASIVAADVDGGSTDNCGIASLSIDNSNFTCANVGANNVTLTVTDVNGNVSTCTAIVTVEDHIAPTAVCKNITVQLDANGQVTIVAADVDGGSTDNCGIASISIENSNFTCANVGANNVTLTVTDVNGNVSTCTAIVTVEDHIAPIALCKNITVQLDASGNASIVAADVDGGSTDNCGIASISIENSNFTCANVGANNITLTVTDVNGNVSTCTAIVTVEDHIAPAAVCKNITVQLDASGNASIVAADVDGGSTDNCGIASINISPSTFNCTDVAVPSGPSNNYAVDLTHGDDYIVIGNVTPGGDSYTKEAWVNMSSTTCENIISSSENPFWIVAGYLTAGNSNTYYVLQDPTGFPTNTWTHVAVTYDAPATTMKLYRNGVLVAVNTSSPGNSGGTTAIGKHFGGGCNFDGKVDEVRIWNYARTISDIQDNMNQTISGSELGLVAYYPMENGPSGTSLTDASGHGFNGSFVNINPSNVWVSGAPSVNQIITASTVTLTVTDINGNISTCTSMVTVEDHVAPVALCKNVTIQLGVNGQATITAADVDGGSTDACGIASLSVNPSTFTCINAGANTVTLTVTDVNGNVSTCTAIVTVEDHTIPVFTSCPGSVTLNALTNNCFQNHGWPKPSFTDNCNAALSVTTSDPTVIVFDFGVTQFASFPVGTTTVTYTLTDASGNASTCSFNVTVKDIQKPTITGCPSNITANTAAGLCGNNVYWNQPTASDNCSGVSLTATHVPGDLFPVGTTTVMYTATDASGNTSTCSFTVTVKDTEKPTALCKNIVVQLDANGQATITAADVNGGSTDNCGISSIAINNSNFYCSNIGTNNVTLIVTDLSGNVSTCTAVVTVKDNVAPVAFCKNITIQLDANGQATIVASDVNGGSADACGIASITVNKTTFNCSNMGANTVILTVTDASGNSSTCTAVVTVEDHIAPTIVCPADITITANNNNCTPQVFWNSVTASDNCSGVTVSSNYNSGDHFPAGTTVVTYTAVDASGNIKTCSFNVTVNTVPLSATVIAKNYGGYNVSCKGSSNGQATATVAGGCLAYTYSWSTSPVQTTATATGLSGGTYTVTIKDANGTNIYRTITILEPALLVADAGANKTVYYGYSPSSCAVLKAAASGGVGPYKYSWSTGSTSSSITVCPSTAKEYTLTVKDANQCIAQSVVKVCVIDVRCNKNCNSPGGKVEICHKSGNSYKTICVSPYAVAAHLAHGDKLGACGTVSACGNEKSELEEADLIVEEISLISYPNPFLHETTVRFHTVESGQVEVSVYNIMGIKVATLFSGTVNAMEVHEEKFTAENLSNGIYFVKLITEQGEVKVERIMLSK